MFCKSCGTQLPDNVGICPSCGTSADTKASDHVDNIYEKLLDNRVIFLGTPIDDHVAELIVAQLLYLDKNDANQDIHLYINSPGGAITAGLAIYDTMQTEITAPVATYAVGLTGGIATLLLVAGKKGKRYADPRATIGFGEIFADETDDPTMLERIRVERDRFNSILSKHTGRTIEQIIEYFARNRTMTAEQALELGFVDAILKTGNSP